MLVFHHINHDAYPIFFLSFQLYFIYRYTKYHHKQLDTHAHKIASREWPKPVFQMLVAASYKRFVLPISDSQCCLGKCFIHISIVVRVARVFLNVYCVQDKQNCRQTKKYILSSDKPHKEEFKGNLVCVMIKTNNWIFELFENVHGYSVINKISDLRWEKLIYKWNKIMDDHLSVASEIK